MSKEKKKMPSIFKMATNFAKDLGKYIKEGAPNVSHSQYTERLDACNKCPNLDKKSMRCTLCGCLIEHKAKWKTTECPDKPTRWKHLFKPLSTPKSDKSRKAIKLNKFLRKAYDQGLWDPKNPETANKLLKEIGYEKGFPHFKDCDGCDRKTSFIKEEKKNKSKGS